MNREEIIQDIEGLIAESNLYFDMYDYEKTESLINEAISKAKTHGLSELLVEGLGELGYFHVKEIGNIEVARNCYSQCIELLKEMNGDGKLIAAYYIRLGNTYHHSDPNKLIELLQLSMLHDAFDDDYITRSRIYEGLAAAHLKLDRLEQARDHYLKALEIHLQSNPGYQTELEWQQILKQLEIVFLKLGDTAKHKEFKKRSEKVLNAFKGGFSDN